MLLQEIVSECAKIVPVVPTKGPSTAPFRSIPTAPQIKFYTALVQGKELTDKQRDELTKSYPTLSKFQMSQQIQWLMGLPWMKKPVTPRPTYQTVIRPIQSTPMQSPPRPATMPKVPQGYYAVVDPADQVLKFYSVRCPQKGHWAGYCFVKQVSGENHLPMGPSDRGRILAEILKDVTGALKRFGQEIGQCGHCRKQLTDETSRQFGIGPVCRKVLGI